MEIAQVLVANFLLANAIFVCVWLYNLHSRDPSIVDSFWGLAQIALAVSTFFLTPNGSQTRNLLLVALVTLWGLRLGIFIWNRWRQTGPDRRYTSMMGKAQRDRGWSFPRASLQLVFLTQGPLLWFNTLPLQLGQIGGPQQLGLLAYVGAAVALFGLIFETIADQQMSRFRNDPASKGTTMNKGLWRFTRHPNYFGEAVFWWGIFIIAIEHPLAWFGLPGVLFMNWTLVKWSGAATLEPRLARTRPGYADYIATTNRFLPWFPKARTGE